MRARRAIWETYQWFRVGEYFGEEPFCLFDTIEPEDVKQGNLDNCELMATLSGLAERDMMEEASAPTAGTKGKPGKRGKTVRELFLVQEVNDAGCYALRLFVDGLPRVVVVDDYLPFKTDKHGDLKLAFAKSSKHSNELWMMLVEKAWAKVCGSYEAAEGGHVDAAILALSGGPTKTYRLTDYLRDIRRVGAAKEERLDKLWATLDEANKKGWVTTASTPQLPADRARTLDEDGARWASVDGRGIRFGHTYTVLDARAVTLANNYTDVILLLRNPSGKSARGAEWTGDWADDCDLWTKHTKKQIDAAARLTS